MNVIIAVLIASVVFAIVMSIARVIIILAAVGVAVIGEREGDRKRRGGRAATWENCQALARPFAKAMSRE
jgi:dolichol kinase